MRCTSGEEVVARYLCVRGVEVDLRLGGAKKASVAPSDLDMAFDDHRLTVRPAVHGGSPGDLGLAGTSWGHVEGTKLEGLHPVPGGIDPQAKVGSVVGAEHEVRRGGDAQDPPQQSQLVTRGRHRRLPSSSRLEGDCVTEVRPRMLQRLRPRPRAQRRLQSPLLCSSEFANGRRKAWQCCVGSCGQVQRLELIWCGLGKPVDGGPLLTDEEAFKQAWRAGVQQHLGQVLATDEEDVVNAKIGWDDIVTWWAVRTLPFSPYWWPTTETVRRGQERPSIFERCSKRVGVVAALVQVAQPVPHRVHDVDQCRWSIRKRSVKAGRQHPKRGGDLRDLGEAPGHPSVLEERSELQLLRGELDVAFGVQLERGVDVDLGAVLHP